MSRPTAGQAVAAKCKNCMQVERHQRGIDCLSRCCPLYQSSPFRGKTDPSRLPKKQGEVALAVFTESMAEAHALTPCKAPTFGVIAAMCRECIGDCGPHCTSETCPLLPLTPLQPGGRPKVKGMERAGSAKHLHTGQTTLL